MRCTLISTTMHSLRRILKRGKRERTMNTMTDALKRAACAAIDAQAQRLTAFGRISLPIRSWAIRKRARPERCWRPLPRWV